MTDPIASLTTELAQDPSSLAFLSLAEALRRRGQLESALTVARRGLDRYPEVADAHDIVARILADRGDGDAAFDAWTEALRLAPDHLGAHKGLAFLAFRSGDQRRCLAHLARALELAPGDPTVAQAVERLRADADRSGPAAAAADAETTRRREGERGELLLDQRGRVLRGEIRRPDGGEAGDAVAAVLAGASREAERVARLLDLGEWRAIAVEGGPVNYEVRAPTADTLVLVMRGREVPAGRLSRIADRAVDEARRWLADLE
jgi:tetratricopeptide (TPR) repeat protein